MRIGIIIPTLSPGGLQRLAIEETRGLQTAGFQTKLISIIKPLNPWYELLGGISVEYLTDYKFLTPFISEMLNRNMFLFKKINEKFDVIISHNLPSCYTVYKSYPENSLKKISYINDPFEFTLVGNPLQLLFSLSNFKKNLSIKWLEDSDITLVGSIKSQRILKEKIGLESEVLYPTVVEPLPIKKLPNKRDTFFLSVGRIGVHPNYPILLKILKEVKEMKVVLAGSWSHSTNSIVKMFSEDKEIKERVKFVLTPTDEQLRELYLSTRAFIYPGIENFNLSALEAAANGCPIIVCKEAGIYEIFRKYNYPLFIAGDDTASFSETVKDLLADEKKAIKLGNEAYHIAKKYDKEYHIHALIKIINKLV